MFAVGFLTVVFVLVWVSLLVARAIFCLDSFEGLVSWLWASFYCPFNCFCVGWHWPRAIFCFSFWGLLCIGLRPFFVFPFWVLRWVSIGLLLLFVCRFLRFCPFSLGLFLFSLLVIPCVFSFSSSTFQCSLSCTFAFLPLRDFYFLWHLLARFPLFLAFT